VQHEGGQMSIRQFKLPADSTRHVADEVTFQGRILHGGTPLITLALLFTTLKLRCQTAHTALAAVPKLNR
jgi:hypothetical protein